MAILDLIPFSIIERVGNGPGNAAWEFNQAAERVKQATAGVSNEVDAWLEREGWR